MTDVGAVLPGALEPAAFFGRTEELRRLRGDARQLSRGLGRSRAVIARPGFGKTELLRQWHGRLFREGAILPIYFAVGRDGRDPCRFATDFSAQALWQALAFRRRDPQLLNRAPTRRELAEGLRAAWGAAAPLFAETATGADGRSPLSWAALLPHRLAAATGTRVLCLLDDAEHLLEAAAQTPWPTEAVTSPLAPLLLAFDDPGAPNRLLGHAAAAAVTLDGLAPLSRDAASQLARHLSRVAGLELVDGAVDALVREAAGSPFYLGALVRALAAEEGCGPDDVARAAAAAICDGELARYWIDRLAGFLPERGVRATAVEILAYCIREEHEAPDASLLPGLMLKDERAVEAALAGLCRAGVARVDCARIEVDEDPVFREAVAALYRREFGRAARSAVTAAAAAGKVGGAAVVDRRRAQARFREELAALLRRWHGQQVPAVLFNAGAFEARHGSLPEGELPAALAAEEATVTLPRVISVASGRVGCGVSPPGPEVDALAWAMRAGVDSPEAEVAWVAERFPGGAGCAGRLAAFDRQVAALQSAGDLPSLRLVRWAILDSPPDAEGERAAADLRLATSTPRQLTQLAALLGVAAPAPADPAAAGPPALEMEMTIPRAADAELVAARALEQFAENLEISPEECGRLKTALVEACINAFEHSGDPDGRVRLWFASSAGRLLIRVENRGRTLDAAPAPVAADGAGAPRRRGWGLTLIRRLVDEVRLEPREDGVSLLMVKNLAGAGRG